MNPNPIVAFLPLILMLTISLVLAIVIAKKKGKNVFLWGLLSVIPLVNMFAILLLASSTDSKVLKDIEELKEQITELKKDI